MKLEWKMNDAGLFAWFDGCKQISGAYRSEDEKEYAYDAHRLKLLEDDKPTNTHDYNTWYSAYSKHLAITHSDSELFEMFVDIDEQLSSATATHLRAIEKSHSIQGNSQHRAQAGNVVRGLSQEKSSVVSAREIHKLFPQYTKQYARLS